MILIDIKSHAESFSTRINAFLDNWFLNKFFNVTSNFRMYATEIIILLQHNILKNNKNQRKCHLDWNKTQLILS